MMCSFEWLLLLCVYATASRLSAIIVDSRFDAPVIASISNARHHIRHLVPIFLRTDKKHWEHVREAMNGMPNVHIQNASYESTTEQAYNQLFMSPDFWESIDSEYVLVFQRDSRFCSYSKHQIQDFVGRFDYIGAPWAQPFYNTRVGNGGFSLRSKKGMVFCSRHKDLKRHYNEDGALAVCLAENNYTVAPVEIAAQFSVETIRLSDEVPLAIHKSWVHIPNDAFLARYCPESIPLQK